MGGALQQLCWLWALGAPCGGLVRASGAAAGCPRLEAPAGGAAWEIPGLGEGCVPGGTPWPPAEGAEAGPRTLLLRPTDAPEIRAVLEGSAEEAFILTADNPHRILLGEYVSAVNQSQLPHRVGRSQVFMSVADAVAGPVLRGLLALGPRDAGSGRAAEALLRGVGKRPIASVGWAGSGSLLHQHECTWLYLGSGRKRWLIFPPGLDGKRLKEISEDPCEFVSDERSLSAEGAVECVQEEGEVVLVPANWWHATCNEAPELTVGWGAQGDITGWSELQVYARDGDIDGYRVSRGAQAESLRPFACADCPPGDDRVGCRELPTRLAAEHGHVAFLEALGAANTRGPLACPGYAGHLLTGAIRAGHVAVARYLLERYPSAARDSSDGLSTPLHRAARNGQLAILQESRPGGPMPDPRPGGRGPLSVAAWSREGTWQPLPAQAP